MATSELSPAKIVLLTVSAAVKADIPTLATLYSDHARILKKELFLRILLTHLPETLPSDVYVPLLKQCDGHAKEAVQESAVDTSEVDTLDEETAKGRVRKLHLLPLAWPDAGEELPQDPMILFLVHRSLRIDQNAGLLSQVPSLLSPFLAQSSYLRQWMVSNVLPLVRMLCEYYPGSPATYSLGDFDALVEADGIRYLLSSAGRASSPGTSNTARDVRTLAGPWIYGHSSRKRRRITPDSGDQSQTKANDQGALAEHLQHHGWNTIYSWMLTIPFENATELIVNWDGPGDVDLGGLVDGHEWMQGGQQRQLELRYARACLATAYRTPNATSHDLSGAYRILERLTVLLSTTDTAISLAKDAFSLGPVPRLAELACNDNLANLRSDHLNDGNNLTAPTEPAMNFLGALIRSAELLRQAGHPLTIRQVGELVLAADHGEQLSVFRSLLLSIKASARDEDAFWTNTRAQVLWLRDWASSTGSTMGVFSTLSVEFIETEILLLLLAKSKYDLARAIYDPASKPPLAPDIREKTLLAAALHAYDNATNASRSRGGVKRCNDIITNFAHVLRNNPRTAQIKHLIYVTDQLGNYRLVLRQGEPFLPINLRIHQDPLAILAKVLELNPKSYTKLTDFMRMGEDMAKADLLPRSDRENITLTSEICAKLCKSAEKRVLSLCIDAALTEDDFETAYSYTINQLGSITVSGSSDAGPTEDGVPDDYAWRAALQAGKYRLNDQSILPTHLGSGGSSNLVIRHLEHRMQCLGCALRLAPRSTLQEILNVYRRCEEELETQIRTEEMKDEEWNQRGDEGTSAMPGGFGVAAATPTHSSRALRAGEEAPVSLFDLSKQSITRAQSGLSALASLRGKAGRGDTTVSTAEPRISTTDKRRNSTDGDLESPTIPTTGQERIRKRDQLKDAAVGTLASGIGWLINAPAPDNDS